MMVYVWTLSDPETRVKIQGDAPTHLSSPSSSREASPGPKGPFCAFGEVAPSGGLAVQQTSLLVQVDMQRTPVFPASIQQPCPSRVDLSSPIPMSPPPTTSCGLSSLSIQSLPNREPFMLNVNGIFYYSKKFCVRPHPHPPSRALSQVVGGEGGWAPNRPNHSYSQCSSALFIYVCGRTNISYMLPFRMNFPSFLSNTYNVVKS